MNLPEVAEYPDSTKFGVYSVTAAETAPLGGGWSLPAADRNLARVGRF
jgi:hypothetical protein